MKVAFVGKGGSGKTTLAACFSAYAASAGEPVLAIDADVNMHMAELLGFSALEKEKHLSHPKAAEAIKEYLKGSNKRILSTAHIKKTTPPGAGSRMLRLNRDNPIFNAYAPHQGNTRLMVVGTYDEEGIGASCYHNNLAILENVLSHTIDGDGAGWIIADMVAGTDAFASSLHAQFDMLVIVVEPTRRSLEVFDHYLALSEEAGVAHSLMVVGNKVRSETDAAFIAQRIPQEKLLGFFADSSYLAELDKNGGRIEIEKLDAVHRLVLEGIRHAAKELQIDPDARLKHLHALHVRYVGQASIKDRFGDLTDQIDPDFSYRQTPV